MHLFPKTTIQTTEGNYVGNLHSPNHCAIVPRTIDTGIS